MKYKVGRHAGMGWRDAQRVLSYHVLKSSRLLFSVRKG